jgi:hypothetical protein
MQNSQELILSGSVVKIGGFFIDKKCIWNPDEFDILGAHNKLFQPKALFKAESRILPELAKIHVERKILQNVA